MTYEVMTGFEKHLRSDEKSRSTVEKYLRDVRAFVDFVDGDVTKESALAYKDRLLESGYAMRSVNSMLCSVNAFLSFIGRDDCKVKTLKIQRDVFCREDRELTKAEFAKLCETALDRGNRRLYMILQTLCGTGIRVSELEFVTVEAVRGDGMTVTLKGKTRTVLLTKELRRRLLEYAQDCGITHGKIFVTRSGKPVSRTNIWREMKNLCRAAKVDEGKVFPHNLRHLFARTFYKLTKDIAKLADVLGHSNIETTRIYIISSGEEHRRELERMRLIC